jgi:cold-inducible RNA-binding protein
LSVPALIHCAANSERNQKVKNIFVGNLSFNSTEDSVRTLFEQYGTVDRVSIVTDRDTGQAKGFGFVEMSGDAEGLRAIESLSGRELNGRALTVNEAKPKAARTSGGGGQRSNNRW